MEFTPIKKDPSRMVIPPNLLDYEVCRATFSWEAVRTELNGLPDSRGLNIAHEAVDRHAAGALRERVALRWLGKNGATVDLTYDALRAESNRFANLLATLGLAAGERVFCLAGRIPELYVAALGTMKNRNVFCPLFSAFGPEPISQRLADRKSVV